MDDLEQKEYQIVLEKQKLRNTRRQERSELLREYQKKYKKGGLESQLNVIKKEQYNLTKRKQCDIIDLEYNILNNQS